MTQSSKQSSVNVRDAYLAIFDAAVSKRAYRVSDLALDFSIDAARASQLATVLCERYALIEVNRDADFSASLLQCSDSERISRKSACDKYMNVTAEDRAKQDREMSERKQAATASESTTRETVTVTASERKQAASKQAASKQAADRVIVLNSIATDSAHRSIVSTTDARYATAYSEHKYERVNASMYCVSCTRDLAHVTTVALCSRCYNRARRASVALFHSSAVIDSLRRAVIAQNDNAQLESFVSLTREYARISVADLTIKQAAKLMRESVLAS